MNVVVRNFRDAPQPQGGEMARRLLTAEDGAPNYMMLYLELAPGGTSPKHTHAWEHEAFILEGQGVLQCAGKEHPLKAGDAVLVPPELEHQFINTGTTVMKRLAVNPLSAARGR